MSNEPEGKRPLLLYLLNGREVRVTVDPREWAQTVNEALRKNHIIEIEEASASSQRKIGINPRAIVYWKPEPNPDENRS